MQGLFRESYVTSSLTTKYKIIMKSNLTRDLHAIEVDAIARLEKSLRKDRQLALSHKRSELDAFRSKIRTANKKHFADMKSLIESELSKSAKILTHRKDGIDQAAANLRKRTEEDQSELS